IFFSGKVATHVDPWVRSSFMVTGSQILVLLIFIKEIPSVPPVNDSLWLIALGVALFGAVLPPLFYALGAYRITAGLANILTSVELPVSIILASIILSESINLMQLIGVLLIISSIIMNEIGFPLRRFSKRGTGIPRKRSASKCEALLFLSIQHSFSSFVYFLIDRMQRQYLLHFPSVHHS